MPEEPNTTTPASSGAPASAGAVSGVQLAQGIGVQEAKGFWADAWSQVLKRPGAVLGLAWVAIVAFFAVFAPLLASGHPIVYTVTSHSGEPVTTYPLWEHLSAGDIFLILYAVFGTAYFILPFAGKRSAKLWHLVLAGVHGALILLTASAIDSIFSARDVSDRMRAWDQSDWFAPTVVVASGIIWSAVIFLIHSARLTPRVLLVGLVGLTASLSAHVKWEDKLEIFPYRAEIAAGNAEATFTLVPFDPSDAETTMFNKPPLSGLYTPAIERAEQLLADRAGTPSLARSELAAVTIDKEMLDEFLRRAIRNSSTTPIDRAEVEADIQEAYQSGQITNGLELVEHLESLPTPRYLMGTDGLGKGVFTQVLHACRLSISIGIVSTGIAVLIGVTVGAIMGYFGGIVDLVLYRVVEIFMAVPVLFLLIVAAGVLPPEMRSIYVMMAIIGCFTWTGAARFTRAEFLKLRGQDFVQSAKSVGLPLRSILFKHMLPNGVTPVLVESSFQIAAAILIEAILSYLGLGPRDQPSWGRLLASAKSDLGVPQWWPAVFPGLAIFLTVLAYNLIGEALRDAIDPKLKKARV